MVVSLNSYGTALEVQADLKGSGNLEMRFGPLSIYSLPGMASDPGALPVERALTALLTSSTVGELANHNLWETGYGLFPDGGRAVDHIAEVLSPSAKDFVLVCQQSRAINTQHWDDPDDWGP